MKNKYELTYEQLKMLLVKYRLQDIYIELSNREMLHINNIKEVYEKLGIKGAIAPLINNVASILTLIEKGKEDSIQVEETLFKIACDTVLILTMIHKGENNETM